MEILPAIDLLNKKAVRLLKGDYEKVTVYSDYPPFFAKEFEKSGAKWIHVVDLDGAKNGTTENFEIIEKIVKETSLKVEVGGGIRNLETVEKYLSLGVERVILGTAAVENEDFLKQALEKYGKKIAVGVDLKDGFVAVKGWLEKTQLSGIEFCKKLEKLGVQTIICTDVSKDGAMQGANFSLYENLIKNVKVNIVASGGVSCLEDIEKLKKTGLYGAIVGKAYYLGAVKIEDCLKVAYDN